MAPAGRAQEENGIVIPRHMLVLLGAMLPIIGALIGFVTAVETGRAVQGTIIDNLASRLAKLEQEFDVDHDAQVRLAQDITQIAARVAEARNERIEAVAALDARMRELSQEAAGARERLAGELAGIKVEQGRLANEIGLLRRFLEQRGLAPTSERAQLGPGGR